MAVKVKVKPGSGKKSITLPSGKVVDKTTDIEKTKEVVRAIRFGDLEVVIASKPNGKSKGEK